jgi:Mn-dependent DtxR family transcriptional regulator
VIHLIFLLVSCALLVGFFVLTRYETRRGVRIYRAERERLDSLVGRIELIVEHVDLGVFLRDELRHQAGRISHDVAHLSLVVVRAAERVLTRLVRRLRAHPEVDTAPRETAREFVKVLSEFKDNLKTTDSETRSEMFDIQ